MPDFGVQMDWLRDMNNDRTISGLAVLVQDIVHLLITVRGTNPRNPERGFGITQQVLSGYTQETLPALASSIESVLLEDERITDADVNADISTGTWVLDMRITTSNAESFSLVGPIGDLRLELTNGE